MDILYKLERATVGEVLTKLADKTNYSTVRAQLRVLEEKGHVHHEEEGLRYVYIPCVPREVARRSALRHVVDTFFEGSKEKAVAALEQSNRTGNSERAAMRNKLPPITSRYWSGLSGNP